MEILRITDNDGENLIEKSYHVIYTENKSFPYHFYDGENLIEMFYHVIDLENKYFIGYGVYNFCLFDKNGKVLEKAKTIKQSGDYIAVINENKIILKNTKLELIGLFPDRFIDIEHYIYFGKYHVIVTKKNIFIYNVDNSIIKLKLKTNKIHRRFRNSNLVLLSFNKNIVTLINQKLKVKKIELNLNDYIIDIVDRYIIIVSDIIDVLIYDFYDDLKLIYYDNLRENLPKVNLHSFRINNGGLYTYVDDMDVGIKINLPSLEHLF